uniref:Uncharacterized protein n=1 Tax=Siphoviridae sp. ctBLh2 TaxID=2827803 RepID=A0A8S5S4G3_9CAUD|nr:MAG TPA: hypothetical protein [Siphoviridae sp. ctBLh2]
MLVSFGKFFLSLRSPTGRVPTSFIGCQRKCEGREDRGGGPETAGGSGSRDRIAGLRARESVW